MMSLDAIGALISNQNIKLVTYGVGTHVLNVRCMDEKFHRNTASSSLSKKQYSLSITSLIKKRKGIALLNDDLRLIDHMRETIIAIDNIS